jgi:hypothetical protein
MSEVLLYGPEVLTYNDPEHPDGIVVPSEMYEDAMYNHKVGDIVRHEVGAPGIGYVKYRITRMDETGIYAVVVKSTAREPNW